jgi:hypothetical protein
MRSFGIVLVLAALLGCGGETVISGIGNSGNWVGEGGVLERVADELAELESVPKVADAELLAAFSAIRERARAGDPDATLVLLRVAAHQREAAD